MDPKDHSELFEALAKGDMNDIEALMAKADELAASFESLNKEFAQAEKNKPALFLAVERDDVAEVRSLIAAGADIAHRDKNGYTATILAACRGNAEMLEVLIEAGAPLDGPSNHNESVLSVLSRQGLFELVAMVLAKGADPAPLKWNSLHRAAALGSMDELRAALEGGAPLEEKDDWERTAFLIALQAGDLGKVQLLLDAGADCKITGRCGKTVMEFAIDRDNAVTLDWLITQGFDIHQTNQFDHTALETAVMHESPKCFARLIEAGADWKRRNQYGFGIMNDATHPEIIKLLMELGADPAELDKEERRKLIGLPAEGAFECNKKDYVAGRFRRFGKANPERMKIPFWEAMVECGWSAFQANNHFGESSFDLGQAVWCRDRFGMSLTPLPDGRWVEVAGEHEDGYDPDFCIYNDVIVHDGKGGFEIYGYPEELFPPTDFHSATLVGEWIYLIGNLGYGSEATPDETQVFRLSTKDWHMERVQTTGPSPGWIHSHEAKPQDGKIRISGGKLSIKAAKGEKSIAPLEGAWLFDPGAHCWLKL